MRINILGGPCCGKSTLASFLFSELKAEGYNIELVTEFVKTWTYTRRPIKSFDQVFIFAQQLHLEDNILNGGFKHLISDSPLFLNCFYGRKNNTPGNKNILEIAKLFEEKYPGIYFFLNRDTKLKYSEVGRYQTQEQALQIDKELKLFIEENVDRNKIFYFCEKNKILEKICEIL